jgi:hypothetical protein
MKKRLYIGVKHHLYQWELEKKLHHPNPNSGYSASVCRGLHTLR